MEVCFTDHHECVPFNVVKPWHELSAEFTMSNTTGATGGATENCLPFRNIWHHPRF
jgi:hypothetical protein